MKNLIYTVAYGGRCWHEAFVMVESLRTYGKFEGDIVVYAEHAAEIPGAKVITDPTPLAFFNPKIAKPFFGLRMDVSAYDKVAFLDTDLIAIKDVAPLFAMDGIRAAPDYGPYVQQCLHSLPELPRKPGELGFNSGTIVSPAGEWNRICRLWWDKLLEVQAAGLYLSHVDQPVFNHLHLSGAINVQPMPFDSVFIWLPEQHITAETFLIHVTQLEKRHTMIALYEMLQLLRPI